MKSKVISGLLIVCISVVVFYSCSKDSSNPTDPSNFSAKGTDYFPISSGKILSGVISGSTTVYDSLGKVTAFDQLNNQTFSGSIGASTVIRNMTANPIYFNERNSSQLGGYITNNNGEIIGFDKSFNSPTIILLPSDLKIGKEWIANPQSPVNAQIKFKLTEVLNNFTNSAGKTFQTTINILVSYKDSTGGTEYYYGYPYKWYEKTSFNGNLYLSKGVGIVGVRLNDYEDIIKENYNSNSYRINNYKKTKANGSIGIMD